MIISPLVSTPNNKKEQIIIMFQIEIKLNRDSVCMGDDVDNHTQTISTAFSSDIPNMIMHIAKKYLPSVAGYGHTWDCILNGVKIATINGNFVKITITSNTSFKTEINELYFKYNSATY